MESIWTKTVAMPQFPSLEGNIKTDVLIIGGGMAGILADLVQERENVYAEVFDPSRSMLKPQLLVNVAESWTELFIGLLVRSFLQNAEHFMAAIPVKLRLPKAIA